MALSGMSLFNVYGCRLSVCSRLPMFSIGSLMLIDVFINVFVFTGAFVGVFLSVDGFIVCQWLFTFLLESYRFNVKSTTPAFFFLLALFVVSSSSLLPFCYYIKSCLC